MCARLYSDVYGRMRAHATYNGQKNETKLFKIINLKIFIMKKITFLVAALCATTLAFAGTITIDESKVTWGTAYADCPSKFTVSGQTFDVVNLIKGKLNAQTDSCLQFSKLDTDKSRAAGYIANKTELALVSIVLTKYGDYQNLTIYAGATAADLAKVNLVESGSTYTATMPEGAKFFKVINESNYTAYCASIVINVEGEIDGGDEDGDATELTVNYAQALYFADYSSEGAYNWTIDLVNETSDEDYDVWMSIDLTTPTQTKLTGTWTTSNGLDIEYSTLDLINGTDTTYLDATNVTLTLKCTGKDDEDYAMYDVVATMVCDDGKTYTVKENLTVYAFDYDTDDEITLEDEITAIRNIEVMSDVYARDGRIYAEEGAQIYTVMGLNVTEQNQKSTLGEGIYIVKAGNKLAKIVVK